jgi:hypothetical protein
MVVAAVLILTGRPVLAQEEPDKVSTTGAGAAAVPALGGSLLKSSLPLAAGMAALDLISGKSVKEVALDFGAYLTAGIAVSAVADGIVYPFLFAAGPPGWLAAGIYTVVKVALSYYLGSKIVEWINQLFGWGGGGKDGSTANGTPAPRRGIKQAVDDVEKKSTDGFAVAPNPTVPDAPNPGLKTNPAPGSNGSGTTTNAGKPGPFGSKPPVGIDGPLGGPWGTDETTSDDMDEWTGAQLDDALANGTEPKKPSTGANVGEIDLSMDPEGILAELVNRMKELKDAGVTDLALDLPASMQSALDIFCKTGDINKLLTDLMLKQNDPLVKLIVEAVKQGIKLIAGGKDASGKSPGIDAAIAKNPDAKIISLKNPPAGTGTTTTGGSGTKSDGTKTDGTTTGGTTTTPGRETRDGSSEKKPDAPFSDGTTTRGREGKGPVVGGGVRTPGKDGKTGTTAGSPVDSAMRKIGTGPRTSPIKDGSKTETGNGTGTRGGDGANATDDAAASEDPAAPVSSLRWKLAVGDVLEYEHNVEQKLNVKSGDTASMQGRTLIATERMEVVGVKPDGNYQVKWEVTRLRALADGKPVYDSQSPEKGGVVGSLLQKALGRPQEFVMTPSGRLDGKRGMNFLVDDASLGELLRAALVLPLPEQDLSELRTWSVDVQEAPVIFHNTRYKFDGRLAAGQAVRGDVAMRLEKAPPSMRISDGVGRQRALFDHAAGMLRESELNFTVTLENATDGRPVRVVNAVKATTKLKSRSKK